MIVTIIFTFSFLFMVWVAWKYRVGAFESWEDWSWVG